MIATLTRVKTVESVKMEKIRIHAPVLLDMLETIVKELILAQTIHVKTEGLAMTSSVFVTHAPVCQDM